MQEGEYEYGTRVGIWRLLRIFEEHDAPFSIFLSSEALAVNPELAEHIRTKKANCDIVSHGRRHGACRPAPVGRPDVGVDWPAFRGRLSWRIAGASWAEEGLLYDAVTTNDDWPYYADVAGRPMLVLPYAVDTNDARFRGDQFGPGYTGSTDFFDYLRDAFDVLYGESGESATMMSIGLHARIMRQVFLPQGKTRWIPLRQVVRDEKAVKIPHHGSSTCARSKASGSRSETTLLPIFHDCLRRPMHGTSTLCLLSLESSCCQLRFIVDRSIGLREKASLEKMMFKWRVNTKYLICIPTRYKSFILLDQR